MTAGVQYIKINSFTVMTNYKKAVYKYRFKNKKTKIVNFHVL